MKLKVHFFTLAEILAVMVIMSIMVSVAMPAFQSSSKGKNLSAAASEIASQVSLARAYALAHHCYTAVVFPQEDELQTLKGTKSIKNASPLPNYYNASCRIAVVTRTGTGRYQFVMWMPDSDWVLLPKGTIIGKNNDDFTLSGKSSEKGNRNATDLKGTESALKSVPIGRLQRLYDDPDTTDSSTTIDMERYIVIRPGGSIVTSGAAQVRVTDGVYNLNKGELQQKVRAKEGEKKMFAYVTVTFSPGTGRATFKHSLLTGSGN